MYLLITRTKSSLLPPEIATSSRGKAREIIAVEKDNKLARSEWSVIITYIFDGMAIASLAI